jgi:hypothetical protein
MSVIDACLRFSQCPAVIDHEDIRDELIRRLDAKTLKARDVASLLNIAPPRITDMRKRERRVQQHEMVPLARFLEMGDDIVSEAPVTMMPVRFPSEERLSEMLKSLLAHAGQMQIADDIARRLARRLPGALAEALTRELQDPLASDGIIPVEDPRPPAKVRRARGQQPRSR